MNAIAPGWDRRIAGVAVLAAAPALIAFGVPAVGHADTNPVQAGAGVGCETIHWGFLGADRRQICDGPKQADGTWQRTRTVFTPSYFKPFSCASMPDWSFGHSSPAPAPSPAPDPFPEPDDSGDSGVSNASFSGSSFSSASFSNRSSLPSSLTCSGGYQVPQNTQTQETYVVAPDTVLPGEPGWLPPGVNNIL